MRRKILLFGIFLIFILLGGKVHTRDLEKAENSGKVKFVAELPVPSEFNLFANGGWNGNWYVGYNHGWVSKLPPVDTENFEKVYLGAKLGQAKSKKQIEEIVGKDAVKDYPYRIMIGASNSKDKKPSGIILTTTDKIPQEGSSVAPLENVRDSRWFWIEIEKDEINKSTYNYIHLWSPDTQMKNARVAPILAGGFGSNKRENSYVIVDGEIKVIKFYEPGIAIKLVGENPPSPEIKIKSFKSHPVDQLKQVIRTAVQGRYITGVGVEINKGQDWEKFPIFVTDPPYDIVFNFGGLEQGEYKLRCWVSNWWGEKAYSDYREFTIEEK
ncbi:MAG: hypothetical protein ACOC5R_00705 [Elusimicrobiota bacterium]